MNLSQLRMFLEVVRRGSLSEAARQHNLTQPAVTRKMQRLEKELNIDLFERGEGHQVVLTRLGRDFLVFAEKVLLDYNNLQESWHSQRNDVQGPLMLAASTTPGEYVVPRLLADFTARYPQVRPTVVILDSDEVENRIILRECDAGFIGRPAIKPHLEDREVWQDEIVLAVPVHHHLAANGRRQINLNELEGEAFIDREEGSGTIQTVHRILAEAGMELPAHKIVMVLGSTQAIISAVAAGLGVGFVSSMATAEAGGRIVPMRINSLPLKRSLHLVFEAGRAQNGSLLLREFLSFVTPDQATPVLDVEETDEED